MTYFEMIGKHTKSYLYFIFVHVVLAMLLIQVETTVTNEYHIFKLPSQQLLYVFVQIKL